MASVISAGTTSTTALNLSGDTTGVLQLQTNGTTAAMTIDTSQNVGIGTSSPNSRLNVSAASSTIGQLRIDGTGTGAGAVFIGQTAGSIGFIHSNTGTLAFGTSTTDNNLVERMRIDSSGVVGIGITTAGSNAGAFTQLQLGGTATANSRTTFFGQNNAAAGGIISNGYFDASNNLVYSQSSYGVCRLYLAGGDFRFENAASGTAGNNVTLTERMRITAAGELLVGTTSPNVYGVDFTQRIVGSGGYISQIQGAGAGADAVQWVHNINTSGTRGFIQFVVSGSTTVGKISSDGSTTTYGTSSDYRLKENIQPIIGALAKVANLKPVTYIWKNTGSTGEGFIAHELAEVCPYAVVGDKDEVDLNGNPAYQTVDTSFLVATLTAAIQEQQAMIEELKQEVAKLKGV